MKLVLLIAFLFSTTTNFSQVDMQFHASCLKEKVRLNEPLIYKKDTLEITTLKMYVTNIQLKNGTKTVFKEKNSFHLIDFTTDSSARIHLTDKKISFTSVSFQLGIDSTTTVSGVYGGDLDPTKGMYWTWQSGYIHLKLEGKSAQNEFVYHVGGFQYPNNSNQKIELALNTSKEINIDLALESIFNQYVFSEEKKIMSPGKAGNALSSILASCFLIHD